eukprot:9487706-Pyramimonas_sp.AAC.1
MESSTEGPSGCIRMRLAAQDSTSWSHREPHRMHCSQRRYSQLHMVGSFAWLMYVVLWFAMFCS